MTMMILENAIKEEISCILCTLIYKNERKHLCLIMELEKIQFLFRQFLSCHKDKSSCREFRIEQGTLTFILTFRLILHLVSAGNQNSCQRLRCFLKSLIDRK